jgi:ribosome biogenesis GTPase A
LRQVPDIIIQVVNYEDFLKYCHRNLPELKDKEIAAIFNILQKNDLIDLD